MTLINLPSTIYNLGVKLAHRLGLYGARHRFYILVLLRLHRVLKRHRESCVCVDLGCGNGKLSQALTRVCNLVIGIDLRAHASWRLYGRDVSIAFICADARLLPLRSNVIDAIIAISLLEHVPKWRCIACEAERVLKVGSLLTIQIPNLKYIVEPHTKFPLLALLPKVVRRVIMTLTGYNDLQFDCTLKNVVKTLIAIDFKILGVVPYHHVEHGAKTLLLAPSYFIVCIKSQY